MGPNNWGQININLVNLRRKRLRGAERFLVRQYEEAPLSLFRLKLEINVDLTPIILSVRLKRWTPFIFYP
jgi:hypothetical protein